MVKREFWIKKIEKAWSKRSIVWLAGVRRSGKTTLCQSLDDIVYFNCDLPEIRAQLSSPTPFLKKYKGKRLVLDEIHRLSNPSELLKIAADAYPETKIVATGSSTLDATEKYSDSLTGRKIEVHLTPLLLEEGALFGNPDIEHRLLFGGLPPFFLSEELPKYEFQEWLSSYWAKDIQELFKLEKRSSFLKFSELLLANSGSMFEASRYADPCEVSRPTISNYLSVMEITYLARVIRPFTNDSTAEIKSAPKVYGFDTGFVCHLRNWERLRPTDYGPLWEHIVLNELVGHLPYEKILYWRSKKGHEIDFIVLRNRNIRPVAIECKWTYRTFNPANFRAFRRRYPQGENYVVVSDIEDYFEKEYGDIIVTFISLPSLVKKLSSK